VSAVNIAAIGRKRANGSPINEYVAIIESMPVCGVAMRKDIVAAFDAPSLWSDIAVGITPHEHSGRGTPSKVAFIIEPIEPPPRCLR
jgi:hypothetical protein